MEQYDMVENMKHCKTFRSCHQNLCPLDYEFDLRTGSDREKCKYMREPKQAKIKGKEFISGGSVMPDEALKFVPKFNLDKLNKASLKRWSQIKDKNTVKPL